MPKHQFDSERFIAEAAKAGDTTGYAIAKRTKLSMSALSRILRSERQPTLASAAVMARTYQLSLDSLIREAA